MATRNDHHSENYEEPLFNIDEDSLDMEFDQLQLLIVPLIFDPAKSPRSSAGNPSTWTMVSLTTITYPRSSQSPISKEQPVANTKKRRYRKSRPSKDFLPDKRKYVQHYTTSGRGGLSNNHNGNNEFHAAKMQLQPAYLSGTRAETINTVWTLVNAIRDKGGRF